MTTELPQRFWAEAYWIGQQPYSADDRVPFREKAIRSSWLAQDAADWEIGAEIRK